MAARSSSAAGRRDLVLELPIVSAAAHLDAPPWLTTPGCSERDVEDIEAAFAVGVITTGGWPEAVDTECAARPNSPIEQRSPAKNRVTSAIQPAQVRKSNDCCRLPSRSISLSASWVAVARRKLSAAAWVAVAAMICGGGLAVRLVGGGQADRGRGFTNNLRLAVECVLGGGEPVSCRTRWSITPTPATDAGQDGCAWASAAWMVARSLEGSRQSVAT